MKVTVNGETRDVIEGQPVADLIRDMGLAGQACAVEVNAEIVPKSQHAEHRLGEGDRIEVVTLIGGG